MKTLYLDCGMGAAGDMLMAALLELLPDRSVFLEKMNNLGLPGVCAVAEPSVKCGITGTHMNITVYGEEEESLDADDHNHHHGEEDHHHEDEDHHHEDDDHDHHHGEEDHAHHHDGHAHHHTSLADVVQLVSHLDIPEPVKRDVEEVYRLIAEAESHAHGKTVEEIHFHEVGTLDAIADVTGVCLLMDELAPDQVLASPVHVGSGHVHCAHGILPVPAPATAWILKGVPMYSQEVKGELCTPTGAALLKYFVKEFKEMPVMTVSKIGYGMGKKDFERANCLRAFLGETKQEGDEIVELVCNLDDMTPEAVGFAQEILFENGALDVYTVAAGMKKNRPGLLFTCMCRREDEEKMTTLMFRHTTTLGIREHVTRRFTLNREQKTVPTPYGEVREKRAFGCGTERSKIEYEDLARVARERGWSLAEAKKALEESR